MLNRVSKDKFHLNILKEVGYILLFITFFVGVMVGSISLKNVDSTSFEEYAESLSESITKADSKEFNINTNGIFYSGIETIVLYWIIGLSIIGTPILIGYLGYKGYSLGYTISTIIKLIGLKAGNQFIFKYLFLKNTVLVFIMIFLTNFCLKNSKNFFEKKNNMKAETLKYSVIVGFALALWLAINFIEKIILTTF